MGCWNNVKPLEFRCHSVMMAINNRKFSSQHQEGLRGQTLKQVCRILVEKYEGKWQVGSRGCNFEDSIGTCFGEQDDSGVQQRTFVNASFCLS